MSHHQDLVDAFMYKGGQALPEVPTVPDLGVRHLRARLILEEAVETVKALGFAVAVTGEDSSGRGTYVEFSVAKRTGDQGVELVERFEPDLVEIIDGCCDTRVVATGTLSACGIKDDVFQEEVDQSNLAKLGPGSWKREDGKIMKPADWNPPRVKEILEGIRASQLSNV